MKAGDQLDTILRKCACGPVKQNLQLVNRIYPEGKTSYNVVGEIPGTDKAGEVVVLSGHLDSWHARLITRSARR